MRFEGTYEVEDDYVGKSRPHHFDIDEYDIEDDMTDDDIEQLYEDFAQADFEQNVSFRLCDVGEFVEWAKERIRERYDILEED
jgi:hypothetical protein